MTTNLIFIIVQDTIKLAQKLLCSIFQNEPLLFENVSEQLELSLS